MKLKKLLSTTLALALALSPVNVFATDLTAFAADSTVSSASKTSEGSVSGNLDYVDTVVYKVALPTTNSLSFYLDPQGLADATASGVSLNDLTNKGAIIGAGVASANNYSSVPILLSCKMYVSDKDKTKAPSGVTFISTNSINESANEAKLTIVPLASGKDVPVSVNAGNVDNSWVNDKAKPIYATSKATANEIRFALDAADYVVVKLSNGKKVLSQNKASGAKISDNTAFCISGNVAKDADWKDLASKTDPLKLNMIFSFSGLKTLNNSSNFETGTKMLTDSATVDKITHPAITVKKNAAANIAVTLAGQFDSMVLNTMNGTSYDTPAKAGTQFVAAPTDKLTFLGTWTSKITTSATLTVTLKDGLTQQITITAN